MLVTQVLQCDSPAAAMMLATLLLLSVWTEGLLLLFRSQLSAQLPSRAPSGPVWSAAKYGCLLIPGYFWLGVDRGWKPHALHKSVSFHCEGASSSLDKLLFWGLGTPRQFFEKSNVLVFCSSCNWAFWLFVRKTKSDRLRINGDWFPENLILWLIDFLI